MIERGARGLVGMTSPLRGEGHAFESHRAHILRKQKMNLKIVPDRRLYGFILTGAILPDLIDKQVGEILLANSIFSGLIRL